MLQWKLELKQAVSMDYHTLDVPICNPYMGPYAFVLLIRQLYLINPSLPSLNSELLQTIQQILAASAIFTHTLEEKYLYLQQYIGISKEDVLQYASVSYAVYMEAKSKLGCDKIRGSYLAAPVRNGKGCIVAIAFILRDAGNVWSAEDAAIFQAALRYLEYRVQGDDEQRAQNIT